MSVDNAMLLRVMSRTVVAFNDDLGALLDGLCPYATHDGGCVVVAGGWKLRSFSNSGGGHCQGCGFDRRNDDPPLSSMQTQLRTRTLFLDNCAFYIMFITRIDISMTIRRETHTLALECERQCQTFLDTSHNATFGAFSGTAALTSRPQFIYRTVVADQCIRPTENRMRARRLLRHSSTQN
jgi:hypothetical protein